MNKMKIIIATLLTVLFNNAYCQDSTIFYFDNYNISSNIDSSDFYRITNVDVLQKYKVHIKEYYKNGNIKRVGEYSSVGKVEVTELEDFYVYSVGENYLKDGQFKEWDELGDMVSEIQYKMGSIKGKPRSSETVSVRIDKEARFDGGMDSVSTYVSNNLKYPKDAVANRIEGTVVVQFAINSKGHVVDVKVLKNVCVSIDREAVRVIESMPKWEPAIMGGQSVKQSFVMPLIFKL